MLVNTSKFRPQAQAKGRSTVYGALPEDYDRHDKMFLKYEDLFPSPNRGDRPTQPSRLAAPFSSFHPSLFAELRALNLLDVGDEDLPGALGAR